MISKETIKTFLLYLSFAAVVVLSVNTYMLVENQKRILDNQSQGLPIVNDTNKKITSMDETLLQLSKKIQ